MTDSIKVNQLAKELKSAKVKLIVKAERGGIYENFGQRELRKIEDEFINISSYTDEMNEMRNMIDEFDNWSARYNG